MGKVITYSFLLISGLVISQFLRDTGATTIRLLTMFALAFIMIHVGYEFEIDKRHPGQYAWDYVVAGTAAAFPWLFCAVYFIVVMSPREAWGTAESWTAALLQARFASPTSAGVLFSMLAAAGLAATWVFQKARVLAIFDDLDTILLMIPLKMLMVGLVWQLPIIIAVIVILLWLAWKYLHSIKLPITWPFVMLYSALITFVCEAIYVGSKILDDTVPVHLEVLLPAFVLGCVLARPHGSHPHSDDSRPGHEEGPESAQEQSVSTIVSGCFMVLVGLSLPPIITGAGVNWGRITAHVIAITLLSNLGKMFPAVCYREQASWQERLALAIGMFPRGEVGAGVLVISLSYGLAGEAMTVAVLSLALNLLCTGLFILVVKKLVEAAPRTAKPD